MITGVSLAILLLRSGYYCCKKKKYKKEAKIEKQPQNVDL